MNKSAMTNKEKFAFLESRGWSQYYNENAWIHQRVITGGQDFARYTLSTNDAIDNELEYQRSNQGIK